MTTIQANFLKDRTYIAVAMTHFFVDVLNSGRNILVAILAISLGLSNAQVGIALLLYNIGGAVSQPFFGWLADKIGARQLVIGGMGWMIFFYTISSFASDWVSLIALTIASLGSGAFHPTGTMVAGQVNKTHQSRATAVFFMVGQLGLFLGPVLTGLLLAEYGRFGYILLPLLSLTAFISGWQWISHKETPKPQINHHLRSPAPLLPNAPFKWRQAILLFTVILAGSTMSIAAITFAPKLFTELNYDARYVGLLSGLFMMGSAFGGIIGGILGDRIQGKWVIIIGMLGAVLPVYFYIPAEGIARFLLLMTAGFFSGMPHTVLVLAVQSLLPKNRAMASGFALGTMFFGGAVGSYFLGIVADNVGLAMALQGTAVLPIIAVLVAYFLSAAQDPKGFDFE